MKTLRIVSADMGTAESLQTMLIRGKQFHVLPVLRDGRELLERYMEERTDVLLIDLELPGIDGLEILEAICSLPLLRRPQLFVMAGEGTSSVLERMGDEIAYCFLKPLDPRKTASQLYALTRGESPAVRPDGQVFVLCHGASPFASVDSSIILPNPGGCQYVPSPSMGPAEAVLALLRPLERGMRYILRIAAKKRIILSSE